MKKDKIIYWVTTSIVALMGLMAGISYFVVPMIADEFKHLGFPDYFRIELGAVKLIGAFTLVLPMVANRVKEWAYAGFTFVFISAGIAHTVIEGLSAAMPPLFSLLFLAVSYVYFTKINKRKAIAV